MEEKRTCSSCGARLRPGARFCSACGAIIRNNARPEPVQPVQDAVKTPVEPVQQPTRVPRPKEVQPKQQEVYYYEKPSKKQKEPKREVPKEPKQPKQSKNKKDSFSVDLLGDKIHLWNALTAVTSIIPLILGIMILSLNFISATYEGSNIVLSMTDCFNELFGRDFPIFYEITTEIMGLCGNVALLSIVYLVIAGIQVLYNLIMYGRYDKVVLLINTIFSGLLTIVAGLFIVFYASIMSKCNAVADLSNVSTYAILVLVITVLVLILDILKLTIFYQKKSADLDRPSYLLHLLSLLGKKVWIVVGGLSGLVLTGGIIAVVLIASVKNPAIEVWENYVNAYNDKDHKTISECYYPEDTKEYKAMAEIYKNEFANNKNVVLEGGIATLDLRTEKYMTIRVEDATIKKDGTKEKLKTLKLYFGKVDEQWYLLSKIDFAKRGNAIEINDFNYEATETIVKIDKNGRFVGFNDLKVSQTDIEKIETIVIPEKVKAIGAGALAGLKNLETIVFPDTLTTIEKGAFKGCTSLEEIQFTNKITTVGDNAFEGCESLETIILPSTLQTVGKDIFKDCVDLTIYTYFNETLPSGYDKDWNATGHKVFMEKQWNGDVESPNRKYVLQIEGNGGSYEFTGGEYYKDGEMVSLPTPTRVGSAFIGWYTTADFKESTKLISNLLEMKKDTTVYAKWETSVYNIKCNLDGGTLGEIDGTHNITYTINDTIVLEEPTKVGYTFKGWLLKGEKEPVLNVTISNSTGDLEYTAVYTPNYYTITFDANGGVGTDSMEVRYNETTRLIKPDSLVYGGMSLTGWNTAPDGTGTSYKINQEITYVSTENLTLYAMWSSLLTLDPGKNAKVEGEVPRISKGQANYKIPVPTTNDYVFFLGWYAGEQQITNANGIGLGRWEFDEKITLKAKWSDTMIKDGVTYYYRGVYPQTRVSDDKIIAALTKKTITDSRGYYEYNGSYYAKVKFDGATDVVYFNDGTRVLYGNTYYFKVEKVLWRVLDEKTNVAITEYVLDALPFYDNSQDRYYEDYKVGITARVYPNDFYESNLHKFLNDGKVNRYSLKDELKEADYETKGFLTSLFGLPTNVDTSVTAATALKYIKYQITVDNTEASTLVPGNEFSTYDTAGYFFPLSHKEYKQTYAEALKGTKAYATDYAIAKEIQCYRTSDGLSQATWWLRSPYYDSSKEALFVDVNGSVANGLVTNAKIGLRPAFIMNTDSGTKE